MLCLTNVGVCMPEHVPAATEVSAEMERKEKKKKMWGKREGRVLQWQTQSVMRDYSVSFSTAIDVIFMRETQAFLRAGAHAIPDPH